MVERKIPQKAQAAIPSRMGGRKSRKHTCFYVPWCYQAGYDENTAPIETGLMKAKTSPPPPPPLPLHPQPV
ncbi:unnamed protein product, partial [Iphiclides podalirius]